MLYTTRPTVLVQAIQWNGDSDIANSWLGEAYGSDWEYILNSTAIKFSDETGTDIAEEGDWLVVLPGEIHPRVYTDVEFQILFEGED